ncbi:Ran-binding protein 10 [Trametes pubescens]|uniref:Ran-binding protein 10 n=1 Tax=Trametes pubescens TaxID=154538 RepID=A0A1M2VK16_TRAPU|nr:Ran-binding protein 10 [Trametes pubescens]
MVPRGRPTGPAQSTLPVFEPRIIRATTSPTPSRDPGCNAPYSPSTSPVRPRRLSAGVRPQSAVSSSSLSQRSIPLATHGNAPTSQGFPRPTYLDYSSLREMLHTEPAPSPLVPVARSTAYSVASSDARSSASPAPPAIPYPYIRRELSPVGDSDDESIATPPPSQPTTLGAVTVLSTNTVLMLPTRWSEQDRTPSLSVSLDGRELTFTGPSCMGDRESSAARANQPIPPACGIYYYEVEIVHKCPKGFSAPDVRLSRLPGWERNSWGYHADDGWAFPGHKDGSPYGPTFDTGDVIGCGVDFSQNRVFYTKNGSFLGMVFENVGKATDIYPCIGMRQTNESIRANFGNAPFRFAIEEHVRAQRDHVWDGIMNSPVDWSVLGLASRKTEERKMEDRKVAETTTVEDEESKAPLRKLVLAYLAHHGYARTARAFQKQCTERSQVASTIVQVQTKTEPEDEDAAMMETDETPAAGSSTRPKVDVKRDSEFGLDYDLNTRLSITNAIIRGDIDTALTLIRVDHSTVLEREQGLVLFRLRCRKFVELVLEAGEALRKVKEAEREAALARAKDPALTDDSAIDGAGDGAVGEMDGMGAMDVDDPSPEAHSTPSTSTPTVSTSVSVVSVTPASPIAPSPVQTAHAALAALAKNALHTALSYGQTLEADYKSDLRPGVRAHLRRTFGVVAYDDPIAVGGEVAEMAGQAARDALAAEVNQAILESQGRPAHPALETLYRQASACVTRLGQLGAGAAAFADVRKEFLEG